MPLPPRVMRIPSILMNPSAQSAREAPRRIAPRAVSIWISGSGSGNAQRRQSRGTICYRVGSPGLSARRLGHGRLAEGAAENRFRVEGIFCQETMAQDMREDRLQMVRMHGTSSVQKGVCPGGGLEREGSTD